MFDLCSRRGLFAAAAATTLALASTTAAQAQTKVGFVYVGPVGDYGWSYQHNVGRLAIEEAFGDQVETTYVESVPEGADAERVIRQLASSGHDLIFTTSFGYMNPTLRVASEFPDVKFEHATGYRRADNVSTYSSRFYEGRAVIGTLAGRLTKTNRIGYVASYPIPEVIRGINAAMIAARKVNPEAEIRVVWVNSWYDPGREAAAAEALMDQDVDVIMQHTDSPAPLQAAAARGLPAFGQASDMRNFGPEAQVTAILDIWDEYYISRVQAVIDGTWESTDTWGGFDDGMVVMAPYLEGFDAELLAEAKAIEAGITDGSLHPFAGPIIAQDGTEVIPAGDVLSDDVLLGMNYYVQGVVGQVPN